MSSITIRKAIIEDAPILFATEQQTSQTPGFLVSKPHELKLESFVNRIRELSENPKENYLVACQGNVIVGHALLEPIGLEALSHIVRLTIVVQPEFTGQGIGKLLLGELIQWAKEVPGIDKIELFTRATNIYAIKLYKHFGFVEEGRLSKHIKVSKNTYIDELSMGLWVK